MSLIETKEASFRNVTFLYTDMPTTGGNRLIKFNFPGSDKQAIEVQGQLPRIFNMTIIIPAENYFQQRDNLIRVLSDGKEGTLVHPTFGDVENIIPGPFNLSEQLSELGKGTITVTFELNDTPGIPIQSGALAAQVQAQNDELVAQIDTDLADNFSVDISLSGNFSDALENLQNVADAFTAAAQVVEPIAAKAAEFKKAVNDFSSQIGLLITQPANLASEISGLYEALNNLFERPENTFNALKALFNFGANDPVFPNDTVARVQRNINRETIRNTMRTQALGFSYIAAAETDYTTTEGLEIANDDLEVQYLDIRDNQSITNSGLEQLDRERVIGQKTLDQVRVNTPTVITVTVDTLRPLSVVVFEYYGDTEFVDIIAELNGIKQTGFVVGDLRILTE